VPKVYNPTVTCYNDDAPLSESGDYTDTYWIVKSNIELLKKERNWPKLREIEEMPKQSEKANYGTFRINQYLTLNDALSKITKSFNYESPKPMELLDLGENYGQNFGYILYRTIVSEKFSTLKFESRIADRAIIAINYKNIITLDDVNQYNITVEFTTDNFNNSINNNTFHTLDIIVENLGRLNFGDSDELNNQRKGLNGRVFIDNTVHYNWTVYPLEFNNDFMNNLLNSNDWKTEINTNNGFYTHYPSFYGTELYISETPKDTYLKVNSNLEKGVVFVNGFNTGRYWSFGPQKTNYIPSAILNKGNNSVVVFDLHSNYNNYLNMNVTFLYNHVFQ
jgi:beta-galactosidase